MSNQIKKSIEPKSASSTGSPDKDAPKRRYPFSNGGRDRCGEGFAGKISGEGRKEESLDE